VEEKCINIYTTITESTAITEQISQRLTLPCSCLKPNQHCPSLEPSSYMGDPLPHQTHPPPSLGRHRNPHLGHPPSRLLLRPELHLGPVPRRCPWRSDQAAADASDQQASSAAAASTQQASRAPAASSPAAPPLGFARCRDGVERD
jgi:hypothetical protein